MRNALLGFGLLVLMGAVVGCTTARPPELKPVGKVTVTINPDDRPTRVTVKLANELVIVLPAPKPAGYRWQIAQHNALTLKQLTEITPNGPGGEWTISFMALRISGTRLLFALIPPTDRPESEPVDLEEVQVVIEG